MKYLSAFILLFYSAFSFANASLPNSPHVAITGTAEISVKPDIVILSVEAESLKETSAEAKQTLDKRIDLFLAGLNNFGINESNVSASEISVRESTSYVQGQGQKINGYKASRRLKLTFENIAQLSPLIDFALKLEINRINTIELKSSKSTLYQNEVNALALENAQTNAQFFANTLNAKLGAVYSINANKAQQHYRYGNNAFSDGIQALEVRGGSMGDPEQAKYLQANIVFSSSINVVFEMKIQGK